MASSKSKAPRKIDVEYVHAVAAAMHLGHVKISVLDKAPSDDAEAEIYAWPERIEAQIMLGEDFPTLSPQAQRERVVHELVHYHVMRLQWFVDPIAKHIGKDGLDALMAAYTQVEEETVQTLTTLAVHAVPLPSRRGKKGRRC